MLVSGELCSSPVRGQRQAFWPFVADFVEIRVFLGVNHLIVRVRFK